MRRLLIRPGGIGDCILAFPAMEHLRSSHTEVWVPSAVVPLVQFADAVQSISDTGLNLLGIPDVTVPEPLRDRLRCFDSIVSWYGSNRAEFREAILAINPNCEFHTALPPPEYHGHAIDFFAAQVGAPPGLLPHIRAHNSAHRKSIAVHPFSGSKKKNWPLSSYRELARQLGCDIDWLAGPEEELPEAQRFENLAELAGFIAAARLYIGNDSGITHLAAAAGAKTIAIFGPTSAEVWAPRGDHVFRDTTLRA